MQLQWYGHGYFRLEGKGALLATDPFTKEIGLKSPKVKADIALTSHSFKYLDKDTGEAFLIDGPGEYEVKEVYIRGVDSKDKEGNLNTMYFINMDDIKIAYLGGFGEKELSEKQLEVLGDAEVLILPVGDNNVLGYKEAVNVISQIQPKIIIPMYYMTDGIKINLDGPDKFLKEIGIKPEKVDKLKLLKKDLPVDESKLIILET